MIPSIHEHTPGGLKTSLSILDSRKRSKLRQQIMVISGGSEGMQCLTLLD